MMVIGRGIAGVGAGMSNQNEPATPRNKTTQVNISRWRVCGVHIPGTRVRRQYSRDEAQTRYARGCLDKRRHHFWLRRF